MSGVYLKRLKAKYKKCKDRLRSVSKKNFAELLGKTREIMFGMVERAELNVSVKSLYFEFLLKF